MGKQNNNYRQGKKYRAKAKKMVREHNYQDAFADEEKGKKFPQSKANTTAMNDVSWYTKNPQMLKDVASFSYVNPLGAPFRIDRVLADPVNDNYVGAGFTTIPGLMSIQLNPTPGLSVDAASPINIASINLYDYTRYKNSGAANYDNPDLTMYYLAMDSLYSAWNWLKRIYGLVSSTSQTNRYQPYAYAAANMVDYDSIRSNLANFRGYINSVAARISAFCVPATLNYMVRHSWLYSNVYKDADSQKAQQYMFVPGYFFKYSETSSSNGGELVPINVTRGRTTLMSYAEIVNLMESMITSLSYSEDINIMSGDTKKAYEGNLFMLTAVPEDYKVEPVYVEEVLLQIHNMNWLNVNQMVSGTDSITQDPNTNYIVYNPQFLNSQSMRESGAVINVPKEQVTPEDTMIATRLKFGLRASTQPNAERNQVEFTTVGSEFVGDIFIYYYSASATFSNKATYNNLTLQKIRLTEVFEFNTEPAATVEQTSSFLTAVAQVVCFDWAPKIYLVAGAATGVDNVVCGVLCDWNMYTIISEDNLEMINEIALLSELNVPVTGAF